MVRLKSPLHKLDLQHKIATIQDGSEISYQYLLSTAPLDRLVGEIITDAPAQYRRAAQDLEHSGVYVAGVGTDFPRSDDTCWMYFPETNAPFYRVTNLHNYSPHIAPAGSNKRALLCEVSFSAHKQENMGDLQQRILDGLANTGLLPVHAGKESSLWSMQVDYGYPTPTLGRDLALAAIQPWLQAHGVYSRGRFGGWRYEVGNMDHSVMQGVEWADLMLKGKAETTYAIPEL